MDRGSSNLVVAICLGNTKTGFAYCFRYDFERDPTSVSTQGFNKGGMPTTLTPTSILFSPDKMFHSFGAEAEEKYTNLCNEDNWEAERWFFFEKFQYNLHGKTLSRNLELLDSTKRKQMRALDVFSAAIGYLKKHFTEELQKRGVRVLDLEITWVLTVPATWDCTARNFMREAAQKADIPGNQLMLVLEPEAAAVYCLEHFKSEKTLSKPGVEFILVDCGKTTIDVSAFKVGARNRLQHLHRPEGIQVGSRVDDAFNDFFFKLFGFDVMITVNRQEYLELMSNFENALLLNETSDKIPIMIPSTLKNSIQYSILRHDYVDKVRVVHNVMVLSRQHFLSFFKKSTDSICQSIETMKARVGSVDAIFLVGELSATDVIHDAVKKAFPRDLVLVAPSPSDAVLTGAVMCGHNPDVIATSMRGRLTEELQKMMKENEETKRETERLTQELQKMTKEKEKETERVTQELEKLMEEMEDNKREIERLTQELQKIRKEKEDKAREVKELKEDIQQMRKEKEHGEIKAKRQTASLTAELGKMKKEKENAEGEARRLIGSLREELQRVKEDQENERNAQIASLEEKLIQVQCDKSTLTAKAGKTEAELRQLKQERMESAAIQRKAEATIQTLQDQLENLQRAEGEIRTMFLEKTKLCDSSKVLLQKLEKEKKQFHMKVVTFQRKLQQAQEETQKVKEEYCQKLEKEMQVSEEFRRQLRTLTEECDFREMVTKSLQRVEDSLKEVAANTEDTNYRRESSLDRDFMNRLPGDVKTKCLQIQSFIGGAGRDFSERLLGRHVTWSTDELEDNNFFFNRSKFWLCIRRWVEASSVPNTDAPLTQDHLTSVCNKLLVDPTSLTEMSRTQVEVLEGNFEFLAERMLVVEVVAYLRNAKKLTEEARSFLLAPGTPRQKVDRLLAVLYSMGEEGYPQLLEALEATQQPHVVHRLKEEEAAIKRLAQGTQEGEGTEEPRGASVAGHCTTEVRDDDTNASDDVQRDDDQGPGVPHEDRQAATLQELQRLLEERGQATVRQVAEVCRVLIHSVHEHISANQSKMEEKLDIVHHSFEEIYYDT